MKIITHAIVIGTGATALMDVWLAFLRRWRVPSLDYALPGRWIGHFSPGRFRHQFLGADSSRAGARAARMNTTLTVVLDWPRLDGKST